MSFGLTRGGLSASLVFILVLVFPNEKAPRLKPGRLMMVDQRGRGGKDRTGGALSHRRPWAAA